MSGTQGERILRLAEMCRKLETEEEKVRPQREREASFLGYGSPPPPQVLPFYASSLSTDEEEQVASLQTEPPSEALAQVSCFNTNPALRQNMQCGVLSYHLNLCNLQCT